MISDPFSDPPKDPSGWVRHLIEETKRLGEVIVDEGKENRKEHAAITKMITALDKAQMLTDWKLKLLIAKISTVVTLVIAALIWLVKNGILEKIF